MSGGGSAVTVEYTDEHHIFREATRKFFEGEFSPHASAWEQAGRVPKSAWKQAAEQGLLCLTIDPRYGGSGADVLFSAILLEEQVKAGAGGIGLSLHSDVVAPYIEKYGTEEQKQRCLPRMAAGEWIGAIAMTEPGTGSDLKAVRTTARKVAGGYVVNGQKTFISNGHSAGLVILVAQVEGGASPGISLLLVETDGLQGFERGRYLKKIGQKAFETAELFFSDVLLPEHALLGGVEGRGFKQLMERLNHERLMTGVAAVATIEQAIATTIAYTKERKVFGQTVFDFQNSRFVLASARTYAEVARVFLDRCLALALKDELTTELAAMLKWWTTEQQCRIVDACLQLHGGYGYMREYPIARMWEDSRISKIYGGTNEIMKEIIGRGL